MTFDLLPVFLQAALLTIAISAASILLGLALGVLVCGAALARNPALAAFGRGYVSFFRGVPLLVQLLLLYNLLPVAGVVIPDVATAIVGLALCTAAYQAENLRGGYASVPRGLIEAADMAGLTPWQTFARIRTPIALRLVLPAVVNEAILILKASSLASLVGIVELTETAKNLAASNFRPLEMYAVAGALYLVLTAAVALCGQGIERRVRWGRAA
jgi:polar amino acid transport system permease protein